MVVKPLASTARGPNWLVQPALNAVAANTCASSMDPNTRRMTSCLGNLAWIPAKATVIT